MLQAADEAMNDDDYVDDLVEWHNWAQLAGVKWLPLWQCTVHSLDRQISIAATLHNTHTKDGRHDLLNYLCKICGGN